MTLTLSTRTGTVTITGDLPYLRLYRDMLLSGLPTLPLSLKVTR